MNAPAGRVVFCTVAVANGGLVFADPERARAVSRIDAALSESRTWGEFRAAMDPEEYERLVSTMFDEEGLERPTPETPFRAEEVPGYCDAEAGVDPVFAPREFVIDTRELARGVPARAETHPRAWGAGQRPRASPWAVRGEEPRVVRWKDVAEEHAKAGELVAQLLLKEGVGLEPGVVLLLDVDGSERAMKPRNLYVAASRARLRLHVFARNGVELNLLP